MLNYVRRADGGMDGVRVGFFNSIEEEYAVLEREVVWPGETAVVPVDYSAGATPCSSQCIRSCMHCTDKRRP